MHIFGKIVMKNTKRLQRRAEMEPAVQEKFEYLESVLGQFIVQTNTSLSRLEKNISALSMELREQNIQSRNPGT